MYQFTEEEAIAFAQSEQWESWTADQIFGMQLFQELLCVPFSVFHEAAEKALGRPVWTHEFAFRDRLKDEWSGKRPAATFAEIVALLPHGRTIVFYEDDGGDDGDAARGDAGGDARRRS